MVSTPNTMGTPVVNAACWMPSAQGPATYSKWAVSPRITAPRQITASNSPDAAHCLAANGISKAPGTQATVTSSSRTPCRPRPPRAPSSRRWVTRSLKRPQTTATRTPEPSTSPVTDRAALKFDDIGLSLANREMADRTGWRGRPGWDRRAISVYSHGHLISAQVRAR